MASEVLDLLADEVPRAFVKPWEQQLRSSILRSQNMFIGNAGIRNSDVFDSKTSSTKRLRTDMKIHSEYANVIEESEGNVKASQPSITAEAKGGHSEAILPMISEKQKPTTIIPFGKKRGIGSSSTALDHLTFRNAQRGAPTCMVDHPKWELMRVVSGHQGWVRALAVDPSNEWFVSGGNDRLIKIWDLASGQLKLSLTGHINTIRGLQVSARHPYLFSCGEDQMIKCWDLEYNKVIRHYHGHLSGVYSLALHPSLDILASGGRDAVVRLWDMRTREQIYVLSGHSGTVMSLLAQQHEPQLVSGSLDKMIRCWDLRSGKTSVVMTHHKKAIRAMALHPRDYSFCSAAADHVKVWKCPKASFERNLENVQTILNGVVIKDDPESPICIAGSDQGHLIFWDWNSGKKFQTIETTPQPGSLSSERAIYCVKLDMSETRLITGECDKTIKVWRQKAG